MKLSKNAITKLAEKKRLFKMWKSENQNENLSEKDAVAQDWFYVVNEDRVLVGFYFKLNQLSNILDLNCLSAIYVFKPYRHQGIATQIAKLSKCDKLMLGFYTMESLAKTKNTFAIVGYTEHKCLIFKKGPFGMSIAEFLTIPDFNSTTNTPSLVFMNAADSQIVRVQNV
jgi:hypothetical protein